MLRELKEEIGLFRHGEIRHVEDFEHRPDFRKGRAALFLVREVEYRFAPSLEIDAVGEFDPEHLPSETTGLTREKIQQALA